MKWKFENTNFVKESLFNPLLRKFYEYGLPGLVRENIQNSLDAKNPEVDAPVVVDINLGKINAESIPGHYEIINHIRSLEFSNEYTKEAIDEMMGFIDLKSYDYISFEDSNTKGLDGSRFHQIISGKTAYSAYAYSKGAHHILEEENLEEIRGGSHGVGKIASNSASNFNVMFFANCDKDSFQTLGGSIELMEHNLNNQSYRATGYFANEKEGYYYPYNNDSYHYIFEKKTRGLKIIIPYLRKQFSDENEIIKTICDSFLIAIIENKLVVNIGDEIINSTTYMDYVNNNNFFIQKYEEIREYFTPMYVRTLNHMFSDNFIINSATNSYRFYLYFITDANIISGRTGVFRTNGMKIEDHKVKSNVMKPYNAIIRPFSNKSEKYLKSLENESHTELSYKHINSDRLKSEAKKFLSNLDNKIGNIIRKKLEQDVPESEMLDTSDIIYDIENKFMNDLKKKIATVHIQNDSGKGKTIVKTTDSKDKGERYRERNGSKKNEFRNMKKVRKSFGDNDSKEYYVIPNSFVKRIIYRDNEDIKIDFTKTNFKGYKSVNLLISIIDGMGREYRDEVNLNTHYLKAIDKKTYDELKISHFTIHNVRIIDDEVYIKLHFNDSGNKHLKYKYYLEV